MMHANLQNTARTTGGRAVSNGLLPCMHTQNAGILAAHLVSFQRLLHFRDAELQPRVQEYEVQTGCRPIKDGGGPICHDGGPRQP